MKIKDLLEAKAPVDKSNWLYSFPIDLGNGDGDWGGNAAVDKEVAKIGKKFDIRGDVLEYEGPAGGWPEVMFTGTLGNMTKFLKWYHNGDSISAADDAEELVKGNSYWDSAKKKRVKNK